MSREGRARGGGHTARQGAVAPVSAAQAELRALVGACYADPLRFVVTCFPWGTGALTGFAGPDAWQVAFLTELGQEVAQRRFDGIHPVAPIRMAVSSGHGIGKSVLAAWLILWILSTRPRAQGTVSANTFPQLETKTWATLQRWWSLCLTKAWFACTTQRLYVHGARDSWFCAPQSSKDQNSEAFAGQHALTSTSFYVFDEASAIGDRIFEVAEGGLTDGEPMILLLGNPTRSQGLFYRACHGVDRGRWRTHIIDSRTCRFPSQALLEEWAQQYGEQSDFFRVRVRGLPPAASDLQFIDLETIHAAQRREPTALPDDPLLCGLDVARGGMDRCVFRFRRGGDARTIPPVWIPGEEARDSMRLVTLATDILQRTYDGRRVAQLAVDGTGIGGPIVDRLRQLGYRQVVEVQFGGTAPDPKYKNMRTYMWGRLREWLRYGAIPDDPRLETDLAGPGYRHDDRDRVDLESKEQMKARGLDSPDDGDALALTLAVPIGPRVPVTVGVGRTLGEPPGGSWMG